MKFRISTTKLIVKCTGENKAALLIFGKAISKLLLTASAKTVSVCCLSEHCWSTLAMEESTTHTYGRYWLLMLLDFGL